MPCTGDAGEICGGNNAINVYKYADYNSEGCFVDSGSNRVLTAAVLKDADMTTDVRKIILKKAQGGTS